MWYNPATQPSKNTVRTNKSTYYEEMRKKYLPVLELSNEKKKLSQEDNQPVFDCSTYNGLYTGIVVDLIRRKEEGYSYIENHYISNNPEILSRFAEWGEDNTICKSKEFMLNFYEYVKKQPASPDIYHRYVIYDNEYDLDLQCIIPAIHVLEFSTCKYW